MIGSIAADEIGTNLGVWYDVAITTLPTQMASLAPHILRWPGGSVADTYHWQNHTGCTQSGSGYISGTQYEEHSTFMNFMSDVIIPGNYDVALTVDYGTDPTCTAGGLPTEAAAWVASAKASGYNTHVKWWTVGNEEFGGWETDLHPLQHDPATYAASMSGTTGYYQLMKAADPSAQVGVVVVGGPGYSNWDSIVLANAQYDFVEMHWYAQSPGAESDSYLLNQAPGNLSAAINTLRSELASVGKPNTPIMIGEINSVAFDPGKQTVSIVNALFTGMAFGEMLNNHIAVATWWFGMGGSQGCNHNNASTLYGWQSWGAYDLVAANAANSWNTCTNNNGGPFVPEGTLFPSGNAFKMVSQFAVPGENMLATSIGSSATNIRAYAATLSSGYAMMLFNLSNATTNTVSVNLANAVHTSFQASTTTYGKQQYDDSKNNVWTAPVTANLGTVGTTFNVTLPPWSMVVVKLQ